MNMIIQMTNVEKQYLLTKTFAELWKHIWGENVIGNQYKHEENGSRDKFEMLRSGIMGKGQQYSLASLIEESNQYKQWDEPEWGLPKGRRNFEEKDYEGAPSTMCRGTWDF